MQDYLGVLCKKYAHLSLDEMEYIRRIAGALPFLANLHESDVFINCPCSGGDSIVVAQARPDTGKTAYKGSVVGLFSRPCNEPAVSRTIRLGIATKRVVAITQEEIRVIQHCYPINYKGRTIGVVTYEQNASTTGERLSIGVCEDEADQLSPEKGLEFDWEWLFTNGMDEGVLLVDRYGFIAYRNLAARDLFEQLGYVEDILGQDYRNVSLIKMEFSDEPFQQEIRANGRTLLWRISPVGIQTIAFAVFIRDITSKKNQELELVAKSLAVNEMHHRIKNNLQTIISLINLQLRRTENPETIENLKEISSRIRAIATTHQLLAKSISGDAVSLRTVLENISNNILRTGTPGCNVTSTVKGDDLSVDSDTATTAAIIVNELIQNSLEHAFSGRTRGRIEITVRKESSLYCTISVRDDGNGFVKTGRHNLGGTITRSLVEGKLRGTIITETGPRGTSVTFGFPL